MASPRKPTPQNLESARAIYMLDLARGSSHIASAISVASQRAAIDDAIREFRKRHTDGNVSNFLMLLAEDLEKRGKTEHAAAVRGMV